ncbi:MAG: right-handed parallel beta-helix repeat-containing protein, partial [Gammaproteobacteria bacterium]|nr:right-handed parallel beta-helix repeat-containing protein [Gammaproteobacteria bacterium]
MLFKRLLVCLSLLGIASVGHATGYPLLQDLVDSAKPNSILIPPPGTYAGPVTLDFPLTIDGKGQVIIDSNGKGSVIYIDTDGAVIRNLHLTNSGDSHNDIDSGIQVRGNFNVIKDNVIDNCLFGIDLQQSEHNIIRRNRISSKPVELGVRGDSVRLWYSFYNKITDNIIRDSRDMVVW